MPNIAHYLKEEITRVAKKSVKADLDALRKSNNAHRGAIASLKRTVSSLEKELSRLKKQQGAPAKVEEPQGEVVRFRSDGFTSLRAKLALSRAEMGLLLGVSDQSVRKWEIGESRPRKSQLATIAQVRKMGKRAAREAVDALLTINQPKLKKQSPFRSDSPQKVG